MENLTDSRIRLILLDFDGTLADTCEAHANAYISALGEVGLQLDVEKYMSYYFGMGCTEFLTHYGIDDPAERERLHQRKIALYPSFFDTVKLNRPLWDFCQAFRAQGGRVLIVSAGSCDNITHVMEYLGISDSIDGMITGRDVARSKPAPDCFLEAMRREGVTPRETLIFEDSEIGIEAARRSGASYFVVKL